jgi:tellurite resistance protein
MSSIVVSDASVKLWLAALHQLALADGDFDAEERRLLTAHLSEILPDADIDWNALPVVGIEALAKGLAAEPGGEEQFLRTAVVVALADGHLSQEELDLLRHWAAVLDCGQAPLADLKPCVEHDASGARAPLASLKHWLDELDPSDPRIAAFIVSLIPAQCPFERDIVLFGHKLVHIPPMCKLNPLYDQLVGLRFRCLGHLPEEQQLRICQQSA